MNICKIICISLHLLLVSVVCSGQCYDLEILRIEFENEPLLLDTPNEITFTFCNITQEIPMDTIGGIRINICPAVNNLLQVSEFSGSGLNYFNFTSSFNCSIAEQFTNIPVSCFDFIVSYEPRIESFIGEYSVDGEETGVHCIRTNIIPSGILIGNPCNNLNNDSYNLCTYSGVSVDTEQLDKDPKIEIYPNPATNFLKLKGLENTGLCRVYNLEGILVLQRTLLADQELALASLDAGVYILEIRDKDEILLLKKKFFVFR